MWPESVRTYGRMRHDATLKAVLQAYFLPLLRATWAVDPEGIDRAEAVDLVAADLGLPVLGETKPAPKAPVAGSGFRWSDHCRMALLDHVYGYMPFERWYDTSGSRTHLAGVQERMPHTVVIIDIDDQGRISNIVQNTQPDPIEAARLLWYVHQREGANWAGVSMLRDCYTAWVLKHETMRVHATSIRRFGMGVPSVEAPPGATPAMIEQAQQLASQMRAGDQSGAGLPSGFKFVLAGLTGSVPDALGFLNFCNHEMAGSALANIIQQGQTTYGSRALGETFLDLFLLSLQTAADAVGDNATYGEPNMPGLAKALVELNWGEGEPVPRIVAPDVGDRHEVTATALAELVKAGALTPDPELETFIRQAWGLPERTEPLQVPPAPPVPGQPAPAGPAPAPGAGPAPAPAPGAGPGAAAAAAARAGVPRGLRRALTAVEARSGYDPLTVQADWQQALDALMAAWAPVRAAQCAALADSVRSVVTSGKIEKLASLAVDTADGTKLLTDAMTGMADRAAQRMIREAWTQAVDVDPARVKIRAGRFGKVAAGRASLAAQYLAAQAGTRALQVTASAADDGAEAGDTVSVFLQGLSDTPLRDQLGAALSAAQNAGRVAVLEAAPEAAGEPVYVASEVLDHNTCPPCEDIDGTEFPTLAEAEAAYVNGGYIECEGFARCRGTIIADWTAAQAAAGEGEGPSPEDAQAFTSAFEDAFAGSPFTGFVNHYTAAEIIAERMTPLLDHGGKAGLLIHVHPDGRVEPTAVFNVSGVKGAGLDLLKRAVADHGANYIECYGPVLNRLYGQLGFVDEAVYPFDPALAAPGWDYAKFDNPEYHIMRLPPEPAHLPVAAAKKAKPEVPGLNLAAAVKAAADEDPDWWAEHGDDAVAAARVVFGIDAP